MEILTLMDKLEAHPYLDKRYHKTNAATKKPEKRRSMLLESMAFRFYILPTLHTLHILHISKQKSGLFLL